MLSANKESILIFITRFCRCTCPGNWGEECLEQNLWGQGLDPFCQTQYSHQWVDGLCYPDSNRKGGFLVLSMEVLFFSKQNGFFFPLSSLFQPSFFYLLSPSIPKNVLHHSKWQPTPVFLPGESHGQRRLVGYSSWCCKILGTAKQPLNNNNNKWFPWSSWEKSCVVGGIERRDKGKECPYCMIKRFSSDYARWVRTNRNI